MTRGKDPKMRVYKGKERKRAESRATPTTDYEMIPPRLLGTLLFTFSFPYSSASENGAFGLLGFS